MLREMRRVERNINESHMHSTSPTTNRNKSTFSPINNLKATQNDQLKNWISFDEKQEKRQIPGTSQTRNRGEFRSIKIRQKKRVFSPETTIGYYDRPETQKYGKLKRFHFFNK